MEIGKCYQLERITGKVVRFKLLKYTNPNERVEMVEHNGGGFLGLDRLTPDEFASIKQIECESDTSS